MKECVVIDGVRSANVRAHAEKGWLRQLRPDELLGNVYKELFKRNPKVNPEDVEAVFCGCANITHVQNDIGRLAWLAHGFPESVPSNTITQQCPSGMAAVEHAARAIMCGEGDTYVASGAEDMAKVSMAMHMDFPPKLGERYSLFDIPMGTTAEKVAKVYNISRVDQENMAYWSNKKAAEAANSGKYKNEIVPMDGLDDAGNKIVVDKDQWVRADVSMEKMATMKPSFSETGTVTAATSSPLTAGACALILMERGKADKLGLKYTLKYVGGVMAGCDPTVMGIGPIFAVKKLLERYKLQTKDIGVWELNEAFASQALAVLRDLGLGQNAPYKNVNVWGGALALGHPLGESGARLVITLNNIMKTDFKDAKYGIATLCGGIGNANASLWMNVSKEK